MGLAWGQVWRAIPYFLPFAYIVPGRNDCGRQEVGASMPDYLGTWHTADATGICAYSVSLVYPTILCCINQCVVWCRCCVCVCELLPCVGGGGVGGIMTLRGSALVITYQQIR